MRLFGVGMGVPPRLNDAGGGSSSSRGWGPMLSLPTAAFVGRRALASALTLVPLPEFVRTAAQNLGTERWTAAVVGGTLLASAVILGAQRIGAGGRSGGCVPD